LNSQELNSIMLYIHPPLAIIGYVLIFLFAILLFQKKNIDKKTKLTGLSLWLFTFSGLLTGMLWAQMAWGSYWSWDPKETMTLALFLTVSVGQAVYFEKKFAAAKWIAVLACVLTILTALSSFIIAGLHSYT
jgi:ABC-type transport system involved in cytochrome c biogenesis permease subunit